MKFEDYVNEMAYRKGSKADKIVYKIAYDWPDYYFDDMPIKELAKLVTKAS